MECATEQQQDEKGDIMDTANSAGSQSKAIVGGLVAALVGAVIWAVVTVTTEYQIGFMAVGIGFLVGYAVRALGKGSTQPFRIIGVLCALFGCLLGNLLSACAFLAKAEDVPVMSAVRAVLADPGVAASLMQATFSAMDLLFYAIAVYEAYKLSVVVSPAPEPAAS
jgi:hypothetical protein